jgi:hypothetical protein
MKAWRVHQLLSRWPRFLGLTEKEQSKLVELVQSLIAEARQAGSSDEDRRDAERYRWLCEDHADAATRERCREIIERMSVRSHGSNSAAIDAAIRAAGGGR